MTFTGFRLGKFNRRAWFPTVAIVGLTIGFADGSDTVKRLFEGPVRKPVIIEFIKQTKSFAEVPDLKGGYTEFIRSDGSVVTEGNGTLYANGDLRPARAIVRPDAEVTMTFDPQTNFLVTRKMGVAEKNGYIRPVSRDDSKSGCLSELHYEFPAATHLQCTLEAQPILGYRVWRAAATIDIQEGHNIVMEDLLAPSLNWHYLQRSVIDGGKFSGRLIAVKVMETDPPQDLFHVPKDAKVVSPGTYKKGLLTARQQQCTDCAEEKTGADRWANKVPPVY